MGEQVRHLLAAGEQVRLVLAAGGRQRLALAVGEWVGDRLRLALGVWEQDRLDLAVGGLQRLVPAVGRLRLGLGVGDPTELGGSSVVTNLEKSPAQEGPPADPVEPASHPSSELQHDWQGCSSTSAHSL